MANIGKPLPRIPDDYLELPPDAIEIQQLSALWDQYAPKQYRGIIDAKPLADKNTVKSIWYWDHAKREYVNAKSGRRVPVRDLQAAMREFTKGFVNG